MAEIGLLIFHEGMASYLIDQRLLILFLRIELIRNRITLLKYYSEAKDRKLFSSFSENKI